LKNFGVAKWRVLVDEPLSGQVNMARDHALLSALGKNEASLRIYGWKNPTISFGRNERVRGHYDKKLASDEGVEFVRRPTGGKAVYHDRELTYSVVLPSARRWGIRSIYREINCAFLESLVSLGVPASVAHHSHRSPHVSNSGFCFQGYAAGEVIVDGKKLVGSAQVREKGSILQHGSLLIAQEQNSLERFCFERENTQCEGNGTSLIEVIGREPTWGTLVAAVLEGFKSVFGGEWCEVGLRETEQEAEAHFLERYSSVSWTWRK
jgi:lipoate-protein ligase A|tara:strand:+ start:8693 stop:9487 length:795 start_codon:yes stop_codon:yes gene_type:complete